MASETNGNGSNKTLMALVAAVVLNTALSAWAGSGAKALERVQALEVSQAAVNAQTKAENEAMKRDLAEIKETTRSIWRAIEERRKREESR